MAYEPKQLKVYEEAVVQRNGATGVLEKLLTKSGETLLDFSNYVTTVKDENDQVLQFVDISGNVLLDFEDTNITFDATTNTAAPVVTGTAAVDSVLSSTTGTWTHRPYAYSYQWYQDAAPIGGATTSTYTVVEADAGTAITCQVAATNRAGTAAAVASNAKNIPA